MSRLSQRLCSISFSRLFPDTVREGQQICRPRVAKQLLYFCRVRVCVRDRDVLSQVLVFVSSKQGCEDLCKSLNQHTNLQAGAIHGDKDQTDRYSQRYEDQATLSFMMSMRVVLHSYRMSMRVVLH